jgi:hypothetical protein
MAIVNARRRCRNKKCAEYAQYGGRGLTFGVTFEEIQATIGIRPAPGFTLERVDNTKGYIPGNLRWATRREQARNRRTNRPLTFFGRRRLLCQLCESTGTNVGAARYRLSRGWSAEQAFLTPPHQKKGAIPVILHLCDECGIRRPIELYSDAHPRVCAPCVRGIQQTQELLASAAVIKVDDATDALLVHG